MYCNNCGNYIGNDQRFCPKCGTPVQQSNVPGQMAPGKKPMSQGLKVTLISVLSAALVGFGVFAYFQWIKPGSNPPPLVANTTPGVSAPSNTGMGGLIPMQTPTASPATSAKTENATRILGAWEWCSESTYYGIDFYDDGTALYVEDGNEYIDTYSISGDTLTLTDTQGYSCAFTIEFITSYGDEYLMITNGEQTLDLLRVDSLTTQGASTPANSTENETKILGAWEWCSEIVYYGFEFYSDGTVLYVEDGYEEYYSYSIHDDTLTLTDSYGDSYQLAFYFETYYEDEYLVLTSGGETLDFARVSSLMY